MAKGEISPEECSKLVSVLESDSCLMEKHREFEEAFQSDPKPEYAQRKESVSVAANNNADNHSITGTTTLTFALLSPQSLCLWI